jgi:hypothetical protein
MPLMSPLEGVMPFKTSRLDWLRTAWASHPAKSPVFQTIVAEELPGWTVRKPYCSLSSFITRTPTEWPCAAVYPMGFGTSSSTGPSPGARTSSPSCVSATGLSNCTAWRRAMSRIRSSESSRCAASSDLPSFSDASSVWGLAGCVAIGAPPRGVVPGPLAHAAPTQTTMAATIANVLTRRRRTADRPAAT